MSLQKANTDCDYWDVSKDEDQFVGEHDGYLRLADPVSHQRGIYLDKRTRKILVKDFISCRKRHLIEGYWHFSDACEVIVLDDGSLKVTNDTEVMCIRIMDIDDIQYELFEGDEKVPAGWLSRHYDVKQPCCTVRWHAEISSDSTFVTEFVCEP